jgi:hypothetical protein
VYLSVKPDQTTKLLTSTLENVMLDVATCLLLFVLDDCSPGGTARQSVDLANLPASDPTLVRCPRGMWTQGLGSNNVDSCGKWR